MKTHYFFSLLLSAWLMIFTNCEENDEIPTDEYFKAIVKGKGTDCGDTFVLTF
jgi:hypothetical protein